MDPNQDNALADQDQTRALLENILQQNHQNPIILPLTQTLIEAILGGDVEIADVMRRVTESETEEEDIASPLRRRYLYTGDETDEEVPSPKRLRFCSSYENNYFFRLSSGEEFYYTEEDVKPTLINEDIEPNPIVRIIIGNMPTGVKDRIHYLAKFRFDEVEETETDGEEDEHGNLPVKPRQFDNVCIQVFSAYMREMKLRAAFRRVWALWKVYRLNKVSNFDMDPITLAAPVNKVILYEPNKKYVFDATSLATWIESKLHYQEYGFAIPKYPCNPWTNVEFTYNQMVSIYYQLKSYGELRWGLTTLRQHDFNKRLWHLYHRSALTMKAIKTNLWALDNNDAREMLEDFIFAMLDELRVHTPARLINGYRNAMRRDPQHWYLQKWKALAFEHLEGEHFGQSRRMSILRAVVSLLKKQELFFKELIQAGIV